MAQVIWFLVVMIIIWQLVKKGIIKTSTGEKKTRRNTSPAKKGYVGYKPHKDITTVGRDMGDKRGSTLRDDRANDWLARQLEEEHRAFKATSEMFDLKIEHASHCDARLLAQFHNKHCDAGGVDLANGKTAHPAHN